MKVVINNGKAQISSLPEDVHILFFAQIYDFSKENDYDEHPNKEGYPHSYILIIEKNKTKEKKIFFGFLYDDMEEFGVLSMEEEKGKKIIKSSKGEQIAIKSSDFATYRGIPMDHIVINELFPEFG